MSRKLILGSVSRRRLMDLAPIGVVNGRMVFPLQGAEDDDPPAGDGGDGTGDDDPDDDNDDDDSDPDDSDDDDAKKAQRTKRQPKDPNRARMNSLAAENRQLKKEKAEREKAEREKALKDKPEIERLTVERDDAVKELTTIREKYAESQVQLAIIAASNGKYDWADIEDVLNHKRLREAIDIDDDGEISGVEEALKDLAKRKPHFLRKKADDGDQSANGKNGKSNGGSSSGKSGGQPGSGGNGDRAADRAALAKKYPILSRLPVE